MDTFLLCREVDQHTCAVCRRALNLSGVVDIAPHGLDGAHGPPGGRRRLRSGSDARAAAMSAGWCSRRGMSNLRKSPTT